MSDFFIARADAVEWLRTLPSGSVDLGITDPAYESLEKHRKVGTTTRLKVSAGSSNPWFPIFPNGRFPEFFKEFYRVLRKNSHLYVFCDDETSYVIKPIAEEAGFRYWHRIVWEKQRIGMGYHYRAKVEYVLFFEKGKRRLNDLGISDYFECAAKEGESISISAAGVRSGYPTEKPVGVLSTLVYQSASPGQLVVDPFSGSGSTGEAALVHGCNFLGCDITEAAVNRSRERLRKCGREAADLPSLLPPNLALFEK